MARAAPRRWLFLIDLAPHPVNSSQGGLRRGRADHVPDCVQRAAQLAPDGVVVVKKDIYPLLKGPLRGAGLNLLHDKGMAFPLGNSRAEFIADSNAARAWL